LLGRFANNHCVRALERCQFGAQSQEEARLRSRTGLQQGQRGIDLDGIRLGECSIHGTQQLVSGFAATSAPPGVGCE
jgi:hypothetical protein